MLRTWYQGWCTRSRFQKQGTCIWGCTHNDDSREYASCPIVWDFARRKLGLTPARMAVDRKIEFYGLHRTWAKEDSRAAIRTAALNYAVCRAHNKWRTSGVGGLAPRRLLSQALIEAARGHPEAIKHLAYFDPWNSQRGISPS